MLIGLVEDMTNMNFGFTRLKVKSTRVTLKKMQTWFPRIILRTIYPELFTFYMLIDFDEDMTSIYIEIIRPKVKFRMITFVKENGSTHLSSELLITEFLYCTC